jgi:hypothetical protein
MGALAHGWSKQGSGGKNLLRLRLICGVQASAPSESIVAMKETHYDILDLHRDLETRTCRCEVHCRWGGTNQVCKTSRRGMPREISEFFSGSADRTIQHIFQQK